jgi:hypothetical protein
MLQNHLLPPEDEDEGEPKQSAHAMIGGTD